MPIKETIEKIKSIFTTWKERLNRKLIATILVAILVLFSLILVMANFKRIKEGKVAPSPSPSPTPTEEIFTPSSYATDSAVLAVEEELKTLEKDLLETDLYETGLNPPVLDMKVEFKE